MSHYNLVTQQTPDCISVGDTIDIFADDEDGYTSGTYTVVGLTPQGDVMLVGMDDTPTAGVICQICVEVNGD